jgi:hypothetical protein
MIVDWEAENERFVFPGGTYKIVVDTWERGESGVKKTPYIMYKAKVMDPEEHAGKTIVVFLYLTEASIWRLQKFVSAAGVDAKPLGKTDDTSPQFEQVLNLCIGRKMFWLVNETNDDKGLPKNDIADFVNDLDQEPVQIQGADGPPDVDWDEKK